MQTSTNVAILGGGVIGCATAYFLRKRGIEVAVLDAGEIGAKHQARLQDCWPRSARYLALAPLQTCCSPAFTCFHR